MRYPKISHSRQHHHAPHQVSTGRKLLASSLNAILAIAMATPTLDHSWEAFRIAAVLNFFLYNLLFLACNENRCLGMIGFGLRWRGPFEWRRHLAHNLLYTASFATLFWFVVFPFDLLVANLLLLQIPALLTRGQTFHALVAGVRSEAVALSELAHSVSFLEPTGLFGVPSKRLEARGTK